MTRKYEKYFEHVVALNEMFIIRWNENLNHKTFFLHQYSVQQQLSVLQ
jgi:hypothetical protein